MFVTTLPSQPDLAALAALPGLTEVLLLHQDLARFGNMDSAEITAAAKTARSLGLSCVLVWDLLPNDSGIANSAACIRQMGSHLFDAIRVQDPGVAQYAIESLPDLPRQLILETGNHNFEGILAWIERLSPVRIILSNELPMSMVTSLRQQTPIPIEVLGMGRLLIFYSPRPLLSPLEQQDQVPARLERVLTEDRKHFPVVQNRHGTFMFYEKDLFLLPWLEELNTAGVTHIRLDLASYDWSRMAQPLAGYLSGQENCLPELKACLAAKLTRGFFKSNRTDKQFAKLKNPHLNLWERGQFVGTVIETRKKKHMVLVSQQSLTVGQELIFVIPEGQQIQHHIEWLAVVNGSRMEKAPAGLVLCNPVPRVSSGSKIYGTSGDSD